MRSFAIITASLVLIIAAFEGCATSSGDAREGFTEDGSAPNEPQQGTDGSSSLPPSSSSGGTSSSSSSSSGGPNDDSGTNNVQDASIDVAIDVEPGGNPVGFPCNQATDCQSQLCKPVVAGSATSVCVKPCSAQTDCADNFFCDPATPGATSGFCVPRSPSHCKTCAASSECGGLSEVCGTAAGDTVKACHIDCTIAGAAACPPDYTCTQTTLDGTGAAKVCRPNSNLSCLDSLGGFCDRVATPQTCSRSNVAGVCVGQRTCLTASTRFNSCGATAPVCKLTCSTTDPAGCNTSYCAEATSQPTNCGTCGTVCPGLNKPNVNVGCEQPTCTFSCKGESYNVDNDKNNGCEITETVQGNHSTNTATNVGDIACYDDSSNPNITGRIPTDSEGHANAAIVGFDTATGSAPDYYSIHAVGQSSTFNPCVNNVDLTLQMNGSAFPSCYHLHVKTNKNTYDCDTDGAGKCRINPDGSSKYDDGTYISVIVSKRNVAGCGPTARDNPTYSVTGHL
jgi:hypothetical protein